MREPLCVQGMHFLSDVALRHVKSLHFHSYLLGPKKGRCQNLLLHEVCQLAGLILIFISFVDAGVVLVLSKTDFISSKSIKICF